MKTHTEDELKRALVKALPGVLESFDDSPSGLVVYWIKNGDPVSMHEWLAIVAKVESKMKQCEKESYASILQGVCGGNRYVSDYTPVFSTWQQRATALLEIGAITL